MKYNATSALGLSCPSGGDFYICEGNSTEFIGCCKSDPCSDGKGTCDSDDLYAMSFNQTMYDLIPPQNCTNSSAEWYTCAYTSPTFLGCCTSNPCAETSGCPSSNVSAAELGTNDAVFTATSTTGTATAAATATGLLSSATATSAAAAAGAGSSSSPTGAIVGGAVGGSLGVLLIAVGAFLYLRHLKQQRHEYREPVAQEPRPQPEAYSEKTPPYSVYGGPTSKGYAPPPSTSQAANFMTTPAPAPASGLAPAPTPHVIYEADSGIVPPSPVPTAAFSPSIMSVASDDHTGGTMSSWGRNTDQNLNRISELPTSP